MMDYKDFEKKYVDGCVWLGEGDGRAYYQNDEGDVIAILTETSQIWQRSKPKYYYGKQAQAIVDVFNKDYENYDEFIDELWFAIG